MKLRREAHHLASRRVPELEQRPMQKLRSTIVQQLSHRTIKAIKGSQRPTVKLVSDHRQPKSCPMNSNLMSPASRQTDYRQG